MASGITFLPPELETQEEAIKRQQRMAEALQSQAFKSPQGQMAGQYYVPPSPLQHVANALQIYASQNRMGDLDKERRGLYEQAGQRRSAEMSKALQAGMPAPASEDASGNVTAARTGGPMAMAQALMQSADPTLQQQGMAMMLKAQEAFTLSPGQRRFQGNQVIAESAPNLHFQDVGGRVIGLNPQSGAQQPGVSIEKTVTPGEQATQKRFETERSELSVPQRAQLGVTMRGQDLVNARSADQNAIANANKNIQLTEGIRKEFEGLPEVKNYKAVLPIIESVKRAPDTPAGDIDLIYGVGKIMDPNSVVREGELNLVIKSGSPAQRLMGYVNYVKGGGRLSQDQRKELEAVMQSRVQALENNYNAARNSYTGIVSTQGLDPKQIFVDLPQYAGPDRRSSNDDPLGLKKKK